MKPASVRRQLPKDWRNVLPQATCRKDLKTAVCTALVSSAVVMEMPMVYHVEAGFYDRVKNGDWVRVDTEKLTVELVEKD